MISHCHRLKPTDSSWMGPSPQAAHDVGREELGPQHSQKSSRGSTVNPPVVDPFLVFIPAILWGAWKSMVIATPGEDTKQLNIFVCKILQAPTSSTSHKQVTWCFIPMLVSALSPRPFLRAWSELKARSIWRMASLGQREWSWWTSRKILADLSLYVAGGTTK